MEFLWHELLFRPLLNFLIFLYNTLGVQNLGLAIIWLTLMVRLALLPLSVKDNRRKHKEFNLQSQLSGLRRSYANNPSVLRDEQRKLMRQYRFRKWPKIILLAVQGLILVILYQVFLGGVYVDVWVDQLYSFINVPYSINTIFLGIDVAHRSAIMSSLPALVLFVTIFLEYKYEKQTNPDLIYLVLFPVFTFLVLWYLPAVKALFILTSQLFSITLQFSRAFYLGTKEHNKIIDSLKEERKLNREAGIPHPKDRF